MIRFASILCAVLSVASLASAKKPAPPANQVTIDSVDYSGDGCPAGTAVASISPDAEAFTVGFSQFQAAIGPGTSGPSKPQCHLHIKLNTPAGWSYALAIVDYLGFAALDASVTASRQATYHISGEAPEQTVSYSFPGGFYGDYVVDDVGGAGAPVYWSRCGKGKNLLIDSVLTIDNHGDGNAGGFVTIDAVDGAIFHLLWKQCS
jgi:hypothetical protein